MLIWSSPEHIKAARAAASAKYGENIIFNDTSHRGKTLQPEGRAFRCTLRCVSSKAPGHRRSATPCYAGGKRRRLVAACWHVHRDFMAALYALDPKARIKTAFADYRDAEDFARKFPATGQLNIGSQMLPTYAEDACDCSE